MKQKLACLLRPVSHAPRPVFTAPAPKTKKHQASEQGLRGCGGGALRTSRGADYAVMCVNRAPRGRQCTT